MSRNSRVFCAVLAASSVTAMALAWGAAARNLYVTHYNSHTVSVVDSASNQVVNTIPIGPETGPYTLAISPDGKTAYSVNYTSGSVSAIDTATNQVVGTPIPILKSSFGIAITPDGTRAYIGNSNKDSVTVIDLQTKQVIGAPIKVCEGVDSVTITPRRDSRIPCLRRQCPRPRYCHGTMVGAPIPVPSPYGAAVTPDGKFVYVADTEGTVAVIDTAINQLIGPLIPTGGNPPDGCDSTTAPAPTSPTTTKTGFRSSTRRPGRWSVRFPALEEFNSPNTPPSAPTARRSSPASSTRIRLSASKPPTIS